MKTTLMEYDLDGNLNPEKVTLIIELDVQDMDEVYKAIALLEGYTPA